MKVELEIRSILRRNISIENKIKNVTDIINWDSKKLKDSIEKHGTSDTKKVSEIIKDFWGEYKR